MSDRFTHMVRWLAACHDCAAHDLLLDTVADDASFRRYFRLTLPDGQTRIVMDAPPALEDSTSFVDIAARWASAGIPVPALFEYTLEEGFIVLEDLGDIMLRQALDDEHRVDTLIDHALSLSTRIAAQPTEGLPVYTAERLRDEMNLVLEWTLPWLELTPPADWPQAIERIVDAITDQPYVTTHRDYTAQNVMVQGERLRVIDFQGAFRGPLSFDLTCLLRDRHAPWPAAKLDHWVAAFHGKAQGIGLITERSPERVRADFEATSAQRSIKVLGGFCRTAFRDGKPRYLGHMPHFLDHACAALAALDERALLDWFEREFRPALATALSHPEALPS
ncbi:aminoglycoside phosphotransferase family protein [Larsenimonas suaedae]|uniref:Phosphotransferase n=1 Tax=Larsenimonas suaedae TaxID=1851019 RepID=A0ABU1GTM6_9GAMM|nr:phosphotransferase [Larsenimonas suaedae]MCM2971833.1 phosphotransferase [Larsenimonas suaedae]MDR5895385.1 phosphotransferase [Larsenimonas suaedae]